MQLGHVAANQGQGFWGSLLRLSPESQPLKTGKLLGPWEWGARKGGARVHPQVGGTSDHTVCWEEGGLDKAWRLGFQRLLNPSPPQPSTPAWLARDLPCTHTHVKEPICSPALTGWGCRKNCPPKQRMQDRAENSLWANILPPIE